MSIKYRDLREFVDALEAEGDLRRVAEPVSARLEMTAVCDAVLRVGGPALLFERPAGYKIPVLANLFGTTRRVALAMGAGAPAALRDIGVLLANLKEPEPPKGVRDAGRLLQMAKTVWTMRPVVASRPVCREVLIDGADVDLGLLPVQLCWPEDAGPLITWGLVITRGPQGLPTSRKRQNLGIYRQQVIGPRQVVMRWLAHRGGALDFAEFAAARPGQPFPMAVALGADPATLLGAVTPVPDTLSEYQFAGLLRGSRTEVCDCSVGDEGEMLQAPATAEFVLEGHIPTATPGFTGTSAAGVPIKEIGGYLYALEGPFGDHTGYYSLADDYPVLKVTAITHRRNAIYPCTIVGPPPMEDRYIGLATERLFLPLARLFVPEMIDYHLPAEGAFHNLALVRIKKRYPGHAFKVMHALWGLGQMMFTKCIVVVDEDVDVQNPGEVVWRALANIDPERDITFVKGPIDVLDHASPLPAFGSKMGVDATRKWPDEGFTREWPDVLKMPAEIKAKVDTLWKDLGL